MKLAKPSSALKKSKRVGRGHGSGLGTTAGRGHKGAGQRSGHKYRFWFEGGQMPLHRRVPMRGFNNSNFAKTFELKKNSNSWCLILVALPQGNRKMVNNTSHKRAFDLLIVPPDYFVQRDICRSYTRFTEPPRRE